MLQRDNRGCAPLPWCLRRVADTTAAAAAAAAAEPFCGKLACVQAGVVLAYLSGPVLGFNSYAAVQVTGWLLQCQLLSSPAGS